MTKTRNSSGVTPEKLSQMLEWIPATRAPLTKSDVLQTTVERLVTCGLAPEKWCQETVASVAASVIKDARLELRRQVPPSSKEVDECGVDILDTTDVEGLGPQISRSKLADFMTKRLKAPERPANTILVETRDETGQPLPLGYARLQQQPVAANRLLRLAANSILDKFVLPVLAGHTVTEFEEIAIYRFLQLLTGLRVDQLWIEPYVEELRCAAMEQINAQVRQQNADNEVIARIDRVQRDAAQPVRIIEAVQKRLAHWMDPLAVPKWARNELLVRYLLSKTSPGGGGGRDGAILPTTAIHLLASPGKLARLIESELTELEPDQGELLRTLIADLRMAAEDGERVKRGWEQVWTERHAREAKKRVPRLFRRPRSSGKKKK